MHETIAECMIFANHWVAKKLHTSFPGHALLRHHPAPQPERFAPLVQCAAARGLSLETGSNKALAQSLDDCVDHSDPHLNKVLPGWICVGYRCTGQKRFCQLYPKTVDYYKAFLSDIFFMHSYTI